jgi:hypothetical protein
MVPRLLLGVGEGGTNACIDGRKEETNEIARWCLEVWLVGHFPVLSLDNQVSKVSQFKKTDIELVCGVHFISKGKVYVLPLSTRPKDPSART